MKTFALLLVALWSFGSASAFAWTVNCGDKSLYYSNGALLKSSSGTFYYQNGALLISSSGSLYYQNGALLKSSSDSIYWQNGALLRSSSGSFYYRNGSLARSSSGTTYSENGSVSNFPIALRDSMSSEIEFAAHASPSFGGVDLRFTVFAGGSGPQLSVRVREDSVECDGFGPGPGGDSEFTIVGNAAEVRVKVRPGYDPTRVRAALQKALESL